MLKRLKPLHDPNVIVGMERLDDAGVYKLTKDIAIIQTIDFITPIVNDPYSFGQIAAANSISDVYCMGGKPVTAMNVVCFCSQTLELSVLNSILRGGSDKMREAGVVLLGGHSINDPEVKYGLSVTGVVHPGKLITNAGAKVGDKLVLTKPLGTGIISTAVKARLASEETIDAITKSMSALNKEASALMVELGAHACTDITGFGLIGHASHFIQEAKYGIKLDIAAIPVFDEALDLVKKELYPGGLVNNRSFYSPLVEFGRRVAEYRRNMLFDPQTSGGLLIALAPPSAEILVERLRRGGAPGAAIIGEIVKTPRGMIAVK